MSEVESLSNDKADVPAPSPRPRNFDWTRDPPPPNLTPFQTLTRNVDWSSSPLGLMASWPLQLRQMCCLIMADPTPAVIYWGDEATNIYNEAYTCLIGQKHPALQGQDPKIGFPELWSTLSGTLQHGRDTGETVVEGQAFVLLHRHGYLEETYFKTKFVPIIGEDGSVVGTYTTVVEVTSEVLAERRYLTSQALAQNIANATDLKLLWKQILISLESNDRDVPMALLYSVQERKSDSVDISPTTTCMLEGTLGIKSGHIVAPAQMVLEEDTEGFVPAFRNALEGNQPLVLLASDGTLPESLADGVEPRGFGAPCTTAVVCTIRAGSFAKPIAILVLGINPRRPYDDSYEDFVALLTGQITTPHVAAVVLKEEIRQGQTAARQAALDHAHLSEQLHARTLEYRHSETIFSRFAERAAVGLVITNADGGVVYANQFWYDLVAYDRDLESPMPWMSTVADADREHIGQMWSRLTVDKLPATLKLRLVKPTTASATASTKPQYTSVYCSAYPDTDEEGNLQIMACLMDISELIYVESQLLLRTQEVEESETRYKQFADGAPIGVCMVNGEGIAVFANDAWYAITEQVRDDTQPLLWLNTVYPDDVARIKSMFAELSPATGPLTAEIRLKRFWRAATGTAKDTDLAETPAWVLVSAYAELGAEDKVNNIVCWVTEISAQKAVEEVLRKKVDEALEMRRQQENFIDVSLRTQWCHHVCFS